MWDESDNRTPLTCFLSMGSDPTDNIERLAKTKGISESYSYLAPQETDVEMLRTLDDNKYTYHVIILTK